MSRNLELALRIQADLGAANAAVDQFTQKIVQSGQAAANTSTKLQSTGVSAAQTANAMRMVPMQMTDIVTQLAGGQNFALVMTQQVGQMKDSFGGIAPMLRALAGAITPVGVAVAGAAVSVGLLGVAYYQGSQEATAFGKANALTNNYIGLTINQLTALSRTVGDTAGSQHLAAEALAEMAGSGKIAGDGIDKITAATVKMEQVGLQAIKTTVKEYAALADEPVKASLKLNETYHHLTLAVYEQIAALEKQGDKDRAAAVAQSALADAQITAANRVKDNLGTLEKAWKQLGEKASKAWDAMMGIGRPQTFDDKLEILNKQLAYYEQLKAKGMMSPAQTAGHEKDADAVNRIKAEIAAIQESKRLENRAAADQQKNLAAQEDAVSAARAIDQLEESTASNAEKRAKALERYHQQLEKIREVNPNDPKLDPAHVAKVEANIANQYKDPTPKKPDHSLENQIAQQDIDLTKQQIAAQRALDAARAGVTFQQGKASDELEVWLQKSAHELKLSPALIASYRARAEWIDRTTKATSDLNYVESLRKKADDIGKTPEQQQDAEITARQLSPDMDAQARKNAADISLKNDAETVKQLRQTYLQESGQTLTALEEQAAQKYGDLMKRLETRGDESGLKIVKGLINIEQIKTQTAALQTQIDNIFTRQSIAENGVQTDIQSGLITEYDARQKLFDIRKNTATQVEALLPNMQRLAQAEFDATGNASSLRNLDELKKKLGELKKVTSELEGAFKNAFTDSMSSALVDLAKGTKDLGDAAASFANGIANSMLNFASKQLAEQAYSGLKSLFSSATTQTGSNAGSAVTGAATTAATTAATATTTASTAAETAAKTAETAAITAATSTTTAMATAMVGMAGTVVPAAATSFGAATIAANALAAAMAAAAAAANAKAATSVIGAATGGFIQGPGSGTSDSIRAWLSNGEFVNRAAVVAQPGALAFLHDFNQRGMAALNEPRFATGGLVGMPRIAAPSRPSYQISAPAALAGGGDNSVAVFNLLDADMLTQKIIENRRFNKHLVQSVGENGNTIQKIWGQ